MDVVEPDDVVEDNPSGVYERWQFTTEVKVRSTHQYLADDSNVYPKPYKQSGEIVYVYEVWPESGYDEDGYVWRRIGENQWVADDDRDGHWEVNLDYIIAKESAVSPTKELYLNEGIVIKVRNCAGLSGKELYRIYPEATSKVRIGPWYQEQTADGYTWYRISATENKWVGDKFDVELGRHYLTIM